MVTAGAEADSPDTLLKPPPQKTHTHGSLQYESLSEMASCDSMVDCFIKLIAKKKKITKCQKPENSQLISLNVNLSGSDFISCDVFLGSSSVKLQRNICC